MSDEESFGGVGGLFGRLADRMGHQVREFIYGGAFSGMLIFYSSRDLRFIANLQ